MDDRPARCEHARARSPAAVAGTMGGAPCGTFLALPAKGNRATRGWTEEIDRRSSMWRCYRALFAKAKSTTASPITDTLWWMNVTIFPRIAFELVARRAKAKFCHRFICHRGAQRWPSPDHLHAVRPGAASGGCAATGRRRDRSRTRCWCAPPDFATKPPFRHFAKCETENPRQEFQKLYDALWRDEKSATG